MQVIVRDRRQGKTTLLIEWLLRGHIQAGYPQWSRVIVSPTYRGAVYTTQMIREYMAKRPTEYGEKWLCQNSRTHLHDVCEAAHQHTAAQIHKSVWSLSDVATNSRGMGRSRFEFAVDDADELLSNFRYEGFFRQPAIIVINGSLYDEDVRD